MLAEKKKEKTVWIPLIGSSSSVSPGVPLSSSSSSCLPPPRPFSYSEPSYKIFESNKNYRNLRRQIVRELRWRKMLLVKNLENEDGERQKRKSFAKGESLKVRLVQCTCMSCDYTHTPIEGFFSFSFSFFILKKILKCSEMCVCVCVCASLALVHTKNTQTEVYIVEKLTRGNWWC